MINIWVVANLVSSDDLDIRAFIRFDDAFEYLQDLGRKSGVQTFVDGDDDEWNLYIDDGHEQINVIAIMRMIHVEV